MKKEKNKIITFSIIKKETEQTNKNNLQKPIITKTKNKNQQASAEKVEKSLA